MRSSLVLMLLLSCCALLSDAAPDDSFMRAVWDDAVADRDALHSALIPAEPALSAAISDSPESKASRALVLLPKVVEH
jgi:hypothetical protein